MLRVNNEICSHLSVSNSAHESIAGDIHEKIRLVKLLKSLQYDLLIEGRHLDPIGGRLYDRV